ALSSVLVVRVTTSACGACGFDFDRLRSGPFEGPATAKASGSAGGSLQNQIKRYAEGLIQKAVEASEITEDLRNVWSGLTALQLAATLLQSRRRVMQWAVLLTLISVAGIYIYVAVLFSFGYYGIARLEGLSTRWRDLATISLFIPISYTNLPRTVPFGFLGGIHSVFVLLLGAGTIVGYLQKKLDSVYDTTVSLSSRLQQQELRTKLLEMTEKFQVKTPPGPGTTAQK
ncbi:MAG TPA: hypothetical protein VF840_13910, partial [Terriglobales bacterium]